MTDQLTSVQAASLAGVRPSTWRKMLSTGHAPAPDGTLGPVNWWHRETIVQWMRYRPGRGARTDLRS